MKVSHEVLRRAESELRRALRGRVLAAEPMAHHTTFHVGGPADLFVVPDGVSELRTVLALAASEALPVTIVGRGSNLLVDDGGIRGVVVQIGNGMDEISVEGRWIRSGAGAALGLLARTAARHALHGLEYGALIPGTLGGAIYMNAGAKGREIQDIARAVRVVGRTGDLRELQAPECRFSYRASRFQEEDSIVVGADLLLEEGEEAEIAQRMAQMQTHRKQTMPIAAACMGATFKRPEGDFAGRLIETAGCKGLRVGGIHVSHLHANYFINDRNGTAAEMRALIELVRERVRAVHGVVLEREVIYAGGDTGWDLPYAGREES